MADTSKHAKDKPKGLSAGKKALVICACALVVVLACCCVAFAAVEQERSQYVPENTVLDGHVEIGGMTREELAELVDRRIANRVDTTIMLSMGDTSRTIEIDEIGAIDTAATVDAAFAPYEENPFMRFIAVAGEAMTGEPERHDIITVCSIDPDALASRVALVAADANTEAKNAGYAYDNATGALVVTPAKQGIVMNEEDAIAKINEAFAGTGNGDANRLNITVDAQITEPESDDPGQAIFVDTRKCRTHLYEGGVEVASYACSPGTSGYATPTGDFYLSYKDAAPTWYNPHSEWAADMPETIEPGPSNPLGVRALAVSCGGGIYLHGTTSTGALGSRASHGCVRHSNSDIVDLYDRVNEGIPIIIR